MRREQAPALRYVKILCKFVGPIHESPVLPWFDGRFVNRPYGFVVSLRLLHIFFSPTKKSTLTGAFLYWIYFARISVMAMRVKMTHASERLMPSFGR